MKILVVDDEITILDCLQEFLVLFGHDVVTADNGKDGLHKFLIEPHLFDAVITDINMPCLNGIDMVTEIRHQQFDTPVVFVSAQRHSTSQEEFQGLMPCQWLDKPFHIQQLESVLRQVESEKTKKANHRSSIQSPLDQNSFGQTKMPVSSVNHIESTQFVHSYP